MTTARLMHERLKGKRPVALLDGQRQRKAIKPTVVTGERKRHPPPYRAKPIIAARRRMVTMCVGVPRVGRWPAERCPSKTLVRYTVRAGRPSPRCGECRVVRAWRAMFTYEDPAGVSAAIVKLAKAGRIGRGVKKA